MERTRRHAPTSGPSQEPRPRSGDQPVAVRRAAMEALGPAVMGEDGPGVVLLTGESGSGKTRLWRALADQAPGDRRFAVVEAAPALDALDFLNLAADELGLDPAERLGTIRIALARTLRDEAAEGRSWVLVVENAHHASPAVWGEIEALCGEDRRDRGFATVLLVGRTELARRFATRPSETMAARVSRHLHLLPLDIDEAAQLAGAADLDPEDLERLHRDSGGNLRRLIRLIDDHRHRARSGLVGTVARPSAPVRPIDQPPRPELAPALQARPAEIEAEPLHAPPPPLVPSRPPLREEEGLIEVGWGGVLDGEAEPVETAIPVDGEEAEAFEDEAPPLGDEAIDDHYAALQAWSEWARNRDRETPEAAAQPADDPEGDEEGDENQDEDAGDREPDADLRGEPPHDHAPYGQLFTTLRQRG